LETSSYQFDTPRSSSTLPEILEIPPPGDGTGQVAYLPVPGVVGYCAGTDGSIWSRWVQGRYNRLADRWRRLVASPGHKKGYLTVKLCGLTRKVHEVILTTFVGPCPDGMECRHLDGNPANSALSNLAWGTHLENEADKLRHGTRKPARARAG
jgi:hypothetical protein